jgi:hypothetical protein
MLILNCYYLFQLQIYLRLLFANDTKIHSLQDIQLILVSWNV